MGGAASKLFAAEGAKVAIIDRNAEAAAAMVAEIKAAGGDAMFAVADVSKRMKSAPLSPRRGGLGGGMFCSTMREPLSSSPSSRRPRRNGTGCRM